jgi:hypothetical protein
MQVSQVIRFNILEFSYVISSNEQGFDMLLDSMF